MLVELRSAGLVDEQLCICLVCLRNRTSDHYLIIDAVALSVPPFETDHSRGILHVVILFVESGVLSIQCGRHLLNPWNTIIHLVLAIHLHHEDGAQELASVSTCAAPGHV